ncbi:UDP-glucuronosyltransferase 2A2 [Neosynchiropus ocellatus]
MVRGQRLSVCVLLTLLAAASVNGGRILVWYTEGSHWINIKPVLETLMDRGHEVTVLVPSSSVFMNSSETARFQYEPFEVPLSSETMEQFLQDLLKFSMYEMDHMNIFQLYMRLSELMEVDMKYNLQHLEAIMTPNMLKKLKDGNYDLMFSDPIYIGSDLLADYLDLPLVYTLRFTLAHHWERYCAQLPAPPSFVPASMSKLTDKMDFFERMWNFLFYAVQDVLLNKVVWLKADKYYTEFKGQPTSACELVGKADLWLMRTYWDFDFPRPSLPNFKFIGGIHCRPAKPLPQDMEEFVQTSGDDGVVVFTLGSMIKNLTDDKANMIASALAQVPQKVLWRYSGNTPLTLGANTRIYDWIPQNDLLGHPKTRAFVTHGGTNGIYEAIYHGIPMVGIPMFADQPENMVHMEAKGMALTVDLNFMKAEDLTNAINTVINDKSYKENAMHLSRIHHDRPMSPLDEAVFWIEFTMRNKGAKHLRVHAHELTWYQYHSLDVMGFLLGVGLLLLWLFVRSCKFCWQRCCSWSGKTKSKAE